MCKMSVLSLLLASALLSVTTELGEGAGAQEDRAMCVGMSGIPGTPGQHGAPGRDGRDGKDGVMGAPGAKGDSGTSGDKGMNGEPGFPGKLGPLGQSGPMGPPGIPGEKGERGGKSENGVGPRSAFSAKMALSTQATRWPMKFDIIITNPQGHYNPITGKFTCASPGAYYFTLFMHSSASGHIVVMIMKNGQLISNVCGRPDEEISGSVVLSLETGDQVWLEMKAPYINLFNDENRDALFSGFLLFPN
ncbi:complement C1q tumor necrosis factor-related protein 5-like [Lampetra planeri]